MLFYIPNQDESQSLGGYAGFYRKVDMSPAKALKEKVVMKCQRREHEHKWQHWVAE
eukprot:CAMPEP_0114564314 /NCGR_PEP_ID=MMETSP0114-20121206/13646_1 /TAXON_ID=31324 /ORGANISM="Goniomonas sp, Strain m" /LENGTH=55 /DNA_ID=CAMNT_0001750357 /DNA_START=12 /DNA_END=176 /DNA_ORIENTATION=+